MTSPDLHFTTVDPSIPGLFFECKCLQSDCAMKNVPVFAFIGAQGSYSFQTETEKCVCSRCRKKISQVIGVALNQCKWSYQGELVEGEMKTSGPKVAHSSHRLMEIEPYSWSWLHLSVAPLEGFSVPPRKRSHQSESGGEESGVKEETRPSAIEPSQSLLKLQAAGFPSLETIRDDVKRKQEIIDILKAETKHKEKEKKSLEDKVRKLREEVRYRQVERLKKAKHSSL